MPIFLGNTTTCSRAVQLRETRNFFHIHGQVMLNAALLLGGAAAQRRCLSLQSHIADSDEMTRHLMRELGALHALLMLDRVGDPDAIETELFQMINPEDPLVEDLCLLADRLQDLLLRIYALSDADRLAADATLDRYAA